ncbi:MAG: hypothetical protein K9M02_12450 [Thiohalocapsa sp.]|nr:hypothetical protein [Thiohalocapsa sp.]
MSQHAPEGVDALPAHIRFLMAPAAAAPSADNTQPWRLHGQAGRFAADYDASEAAARVFASDRHAERLTMGALIENVLQAAEAASLDADWTIDAAGPTYLDGRVRDSQLRDEADKHPLFRRHTNRLRYRNTGLPKPLVETLQDLQQEHCRLLIIDTPDAMGQVRALVELASRLRFRTREIHEWFAAVLRFRPEEVATGTGLDVATIDLPPGGRLLLRVIRDWERLSRLNRLGMYKLLAAIEAKKIQNAGLIIAVVGPSDAESDLAAGRLMERAWLTLTEQDIAVQPFYVVTDLVRRYDAGRLAAPLQEDARNLAQGVARMLPDGDSLHMLLRAGVPAVTPVRARRLPLSQLYRRD